MINVGPPQTGTPDLEGVYVVRYMFASAELFSWWDGFRWSTGSPVAYFAEQGQAVGQSIPRGRRSWRPVRYWRTYTNDGQALIDALSGKRANPSGGGGGGPSPVK